MAEQVQIRPGDKGISFTLKDQNGKDWSLQSFHGKRVLLSFHPLAWTPVCTGQMKALEENYRTFESLNTTAAGISVDSHYCKKAWGEHIGIRLTPLLADFWPHGEIARKYGLFKEDAGFARRANVLLDEHGMVVYVKVYEIHAAPDLQETIRFIQAM
ncbi:MAG: peroxiredoxin [Methanoregulaceae archaeon]|nr:peroxiredoxin [Methanoregulaceae archaeon]